MSGSTRYSTTLWRSRYAREGEDLTERFWPATVHVIGEGHPQVPRRLLACTADGRGDRGYPEREFVHGYLLIDEQKMSKLLGEHHEPDPRSWTSTASDALPVSGSCARCTFGSDGSILTEGFESRYTTELANEYGNLASRAFSMIGRYRDGVVPEAKPPTELAAEFAGLADDVQTRFDQVNLSGALEQFSGGAYEHSTVSSRRPSRGSWRRTHREPPSWTPRSTRSPRGCG